MTSPHHNTACLCVMCTGEVDHVMLWGYTIVAVCEDACEDAACNPSVRCVSSPSDDVLDWSRTLLVAVPQLEFP